MELPPDPLPVALAKHQQGREIEIHWTDGLVQRLAARELRQACPCATCREKRSAKRSPHPAGKSLPPLTVLSDADLAPMTVQGMAPVGGYAYNIQFSDGHASGLFTFEHLRGLSQ
jgi:DUF971 family protein